MVGINFQNNLLIITFFALFFKTFRLENCKFNLMKEKLTFISNYPEASPEQYRSFRSLLIKKYQYRIYYQVEHRSLKIIVFAMIHTSRSDSFIKNRLNL